MTGNITLGRIIKWLEEIFGSYGNPDTLVSDNGTQFVSHDFEDFLRRRNIKHERAPVYSPRSNGLVEVFNISVKYGAQTAFAEGKPFSVGLAELLTTFRSTPGPDGTSPAELLRGWKMRTNCQIMPSSFYSSVQAKLKEVNAIFLN